MNRHTLEVISRNGESFLNSRPHSFLPPPLKLRGRGGVALKIRTKRVVMKKLLRDRGLVERGVSLKKGGFQIFSSVFLQKSMFSLLLENFFFCLVNIHACCNQ